MPSYPETFGDLIDRLRAAGFCDNTNHEADEYLSPMQWQGETRIELSAWRNLPIYGENVRWVACYWVVGGSEGYYVHVDQIVGDERGAVHRLSGKFWTWQRAQECANCAQRLVNGYQEND